MEILIRFNGKSYNFELNNIVMTAFFRDVLKNNPKITKKKSKIKKEVKKNGSNT